jgi:hypothetical protein
LQFFILRGMTVSGRSGFRCVSSVLSLQIRTDFFNILNHPNFGNPVNFLSSPQFGQATQMLASFLGSGGRVEG